MKTRLQDEIDKFLIWWSDGLALIVPKRWRERQQRLKQYLILRPGNDEITIEHYRDGIDTPLTQHSVSMNDPLDQNRAREWLAVRPRLKTLPVILRLEPSVVLVKRLRYPATVENDLHNIIAFDIDRQTPFSRGDVYFDYEALGTDKSDKHLEVDLLVLPKRAIEAIEPVLEAVGLRLAVIDIADRTFFKQGVNLLPKPEIRQAARPAYRMRFALFVLWMALIALIPGKQLLDTADTIRGLEAQERSARTAARKLNALRAEHERLVGKFTFLNQLEAEHTAVIDLLHEVTALLSDDTWINRFDLKNGLLTLQGESDKASEIPGILEASKYFSSPRFASPVTRNNASGKDRFQIVVAVNASGAS